MICTNTFFVQPRWHCKKAIRYKYTSYLHYLSSISQHQFHGDITQLEEHYLYLLKICRNATVILSDQQLVHKNTCMISFLLSSQRASSYHGYTYGQKSKKKSDKSLVSPFFHSFRVDVVFWKMYDCLQSLPSWSPSSCVFFFHAFSFEQWRTCVLFREQRDGDEDSRVCTLIRFLSSPFLSLFVINRKWNIYKQRNVSHHQLQYVFCQLYTFVSYIIHLSPFLLVLSFFIGKPLLFIMHAIKTVYWTPFPEKTLFFLINLFYSVCKISSDH